MSVVIPFPILGDQFEQETAPVLRLVAAHEHSWELRSVEYDETFEVRRYECTSCADVHFR